MKECLQIVEGFFFSDNSSDENDDCANVFTPNPEGPQFPCVSDTIKPSRPLSSSLPMKKDLSPVLRIFHSKWLCWVFLKFNMSPTPSIKLSKVKKKLSWEYKINTAVGFIMNNLRWNKSGCFLQMFASGEGRMLGSPQQYLFCCFIDLQYLFCTECQADYLRFW